MTDSYFLDMIVELRPCHRCKSTNIAKNGKNRSGTQTYTCKDCGGYRVVESKQAGRRVDMAPVERLYQERQGLHPTARMLKVSHRTVLHCLKKAQQLPNFKSTLLRGQADDRLEVDEIFTFVGMKICQIQVWIVPCHRSSQILSFFIGDGSVESCKRLRRKLPYEYLRCFWRAYRYLPTRTHFLVGKESGLTGHVERLNHTLRQRIGRRLRRALSFSKKEIHASSALQTVRLPLQYQPCQLNFSKA